MLFRAITFFYCHTLDRVRRTCFLFAPEVQKLTYQQEPVNGAVC